MSEAETSAASGSASLTQNNDGPDTRRNNNNNRNNNSFYSSQTFSPACKPEIGKFNLHLHTDQAKAIDQWEKSTDSMLDFVSLNNTDFKHVGRILVEGFKLGKMPALSIDAEPTEPDRTADIYKMDVEVADGKGGTKTKTVVDQNLYNHHWEKYKLKFEKWMRTSEADKKKLSALEDGIPKMSRLLINQCSEQLRSALKQQTEWQNLKDYKKPVELAALIRKVMLGFTDALEPNLQGMLITRLYFTFIQGARLGLMRYDKLHR